MAVYKLSLNDTEDFEYHLVALHTTLESYRLAFFLNRLLKILLAKEKPGKKGFQNNFINQFSRFSFCDEKNDIFWTLVENKHNEETENLAISLFDERNTVTTTSYLLPEFKNIDFLLKIEADENQVDVNEICEIINEIDGITMTYPVEYKKIKSKNNLIFN